MKVVLSSVPSKCWWLTPVKNPVQTPFAFAAQPVAADCLSA